MAKNGGKNKTRLIEIAILAFVIVSMALLVIQLSLNTLDIIDQSGGNEVTEQLATPRAPITPDGPLPTPEPITDA